MWIETPIGNVINVAKATDVILDDIMIRVIFSANTETQIEFESKEEAAKALQTIKKHLQPIPAITL